MHPGKFFIGTSNIVVPGNRQSFPEAFQQKSRLHYYSSLFNSVELNTTFYKLPRAATFEKWRKDVPATFKFSIKCWKSITHVKDLCFKEEDVQQFMAASNGLVIKKGCLLIQFPGKITLDYFAKVEALLLQIRQADVVNQWIPALEFRHNSWYTAETNELLDEYGATLVLHDMPKGRNSSINKKAPVLYIRYHGPAGDYRGSYNEDAIQVQASRIHQWLQEGKNVFAYFNNTIGSAFDNAAMLQQLVNGSSRSY